jgi:hypothetical protein
VIFVFSLESSRPRSWRNFVITGNTLTSKISFELAVHIQSSAYLTKLILSPLLSNLKVD